MAKLFSLCNARCAMHDQLGESGGEWLIRERALSSVVRICFAAPDRRIDEAFANGVICPKNTKDCLRSRHSVSLCRLQELSLAMLRSWAEKPADGFGDHEFFIGAYHVGWGPAGGRGNHALIRRISIFIEIDSKKSKAIADPGADRRRILSDASREDESVHSPQRRGKCADPLLYLVAEKCNSFSRARVLRFMLQQFTHVGTGFREAEQPGLKINHLVELLDTHFPGARQIPDETRIKIAGTGAHRHAGGWGETHACVHGLAVMHRSQAGSIAEVGEDDAALCSFRLRQGARVLPLGYSYESP